MKSGFKKGADVIAAIKWIVKKVNERIHEFKEKEEDDLATVLDDNLELLKRIEEEFMDEQDIIITGQEMIDIWPEIKEAYETRLPNQRKERSIDWGEWELEKKTHRKHGYTTGFLIDSIKGKGGSSSTSFYNAIPPEICWELNKINQKGYVFYSTTARVDEIEALSSVPSLPKEMSCEESGERVLNKSKSPDEWQRLVNWVRVNSIENFINLDDNIIANAPILFLNDDNSIKITESNGSVRLYADFQKFLQPIEPKPGETIFCDHAIDENGDSGKDQRPLWLIDGQHRIRGLSESKEGSELFIPIILISNKHEEGTGLNPLSMVAKVFTEINTLQKSLDTLHELFLMHRFGISHPIKKDRDFRPWDIREKSSFNSRANHLSYELAARLTSDEKSPLFTKIKILEQNSSKTTIISADQWIKYTRAWFLGLPYSIDEMKSKDSIIYNEICNFFNALINTCNHLGWSDHRERWVKAGQSKGLIQESSQFQMILELYPKIYSLCYDRHYDDFMDEDDEIITVEVFENILEPLKWCDWRKTSSDLKIFRGGGERGRRALQVWISDAIMAGNSYLEDEVMVDNIKSVAGKGLLAPPKDVELMKSGVWIYKSKDEADGNETLSFYSSRPINAVASASWVVYDQHDNNLTEKIGKLVSKAKNDVATLSMSYDKVMTGVTELKVIVNWRNAGGMSKGVIKVHKPIA